MSTKLPFRIIRGGITAPRGFLATGVAVGIKYSKRKDLALLYSVRPTKAVGVFTTNYVKAAPVQYDMRILPSNSVQAVVANSGCANACTGTAGLRDTEETAKIAAKILGLSSRNVVVYSTGAIGARIPMDKIRRGLREASLRLSVNGGRSAAEAIKTTDIQTKDIALEFKIGTQTVRIGAMTKGSGMIDPTMATMLAFITTDATAPISFLQQSLRQAVTQSFNRITVDNEQSTNDSVLLMANGEAGVTIQPGSPAARIFQKALTEVCIRLAQWIARDGEGATQLIEIRVQGARTEADAGKIAKRVAGSPLLKAAVHGGDPNVGRILAAVGSVGVPVRLEKIKMYVGNVLMARNGELLLKNEKKAAKEMRKDPVTFSVHLGLGGATATAWGCDLTEQYVKINAEYRT